MKNVENTNRPTRTECESIRYQLPGACLSLHIVLFNIFIPQMEKTYGSNKKNNIKARRAESSRAEKIVAAMVDGRRYSSVQQHRKPDKQL